jgi:hypothetical protein
MTMFRYGREHYEEGAYVRHKDAVPGDGLDPVVRIVEDLGTIEIPCGKWTAGPTASSTWSARPAGPKTTLWRSASSPLS